MKLGNVLLRLLVVASLGFLESSSVLAQFVQQTKLVGSVTPGNPTPPQQGFSVALSKDGNTAIVGGPYYFFNSGGAWVFTRTNGTWSEQKYLFGTAGFPIASSQGWSVSLSADGNTAILGAPDDGTSTTNQPGGAFVFIRTNGVWTQQAELMGTGNFGSSRAGSSVALSADGNTAILGGPADNSNIGASWIFTRTNGKWKQQGDKLVGTFVGGGIRVARQGFSVALDSAGNTAIVGGPDADSRTGLAWVFVRTNGVWSQQGDGLSGQSSAAETGHSVALSYDGNTAFVGGPSRTTLGGSVTGAAWGFTRKNGVWSKDQGGGTLVGIGTDIPQQGFSVSLSSDGNTAILGGPGSVSKEGAAWVWIRTNPQLGFWGGTCNAAGDACPFSGTGSIGIAQQGYSVALSGDGMTAIVGGPSDNSGLGAAWIFGTAPLPIQMSSFKATVMSQNGVRLDWVTQSETNNYGFQVQRSRGTQQSYQELTNGFIPGHGTTLEEHQYSFTDLTATAGAWSYRLKQIDLDGSVHYGDAVKIDNVTGPNEIPAVFSLAQNYPNPFNPTTTITVALPRDANVSLEVYNTLGQKVAQVVDGLMTAGYHSVTFDGSQLASGFYVYRMKAGDYVATKKLLVLK